MATNRDSGDNRRHGAIKKRSQFLNPRTGHYTKRDGETGRLDLIEGPEVANADTALVHHRVADRE